MNTSKQSRKAVLAAGLLILPVMALAGEPCARWDISGTWNIIQSNGIAVTLALKQEDNTLQGDATWIKVPPNQHILFAQFGSAPSAQRGGIEGTASSDKVSFRAYWNTNGQIGVYEGTISPQGRLEGETFDKTRPSSRANWFSDRLMTCAAGPAPAGSSPGSANPKTIKQFAHRIRNGAQITQASVLGTTPGSATQMSSPSAVANGSIAPPSHDAPQMTGHPASGVEKGSILGARPADAAAVSPSADNSSGKYMKRIAAQHWGSSEACASGYVWRGARPEDKVCVMPTSRDRVTEENRTAPQRWNPQGAYGASTCASGYVWREAFSGDQVCVTPERRTAVSQENSVAAERLAIR